MFDLDCCDDSRPFGPGIYMSPVEKTANMYSEKFGSTYRVSLSGNPFGVIDLDGPWAKQSHLVVAVGVRLYRLAKMPMSTAVFEMTARDVLDACLAILGGRKRNEFLASQGVWLMHGHLSGFEHSGACDAGVQFILLDVGNVKAIQEI
jgi:hypothetical protein